jgi:hypothetical protein
MHPELMATKTRGSREPIGTALLEQLADIDARSLSASTARKLLELKFDSSHQRRVSVLSRKARDGSLLPAEADELDEYLRVADLLAILQSRARQALKNTARSSREP